MLRKSVTLAFKTITMSIRRNALDWFTAKYGETSDKTFTSKYFLSHESWPKKEVWWPKISMESIDTLKYDFVNILCQVAPLENEYHFLKVPVTFLVENLDKFHLSFGKISLYLSTNPRTLFIEERGEGRLDFSQFLMD